MLTSREIRRQYLDFFREKGHVIVPSASLIPHNDPTLIFTNAGMNQFKDVFLGAGKREYTRAVDTQKCLRVSGKHNDLEEVGRDTYHHTFFEMLGNWSFGDYYKKEAVHWAWELLTGVWRIPKEKLFATVYKTDDETEWIWKRETDINPAQILRFDKDNFWEMGDTGPCGPCTEIHIDLGPARCAKSKQPKHRCGVNQGCSRFVEIWNLVFIQYNRKNDGSLEELPAKHVDTGMGFERIASILQNKQSNYDTDLFSPIIAATEKLSGKQYRNPEYVTSFRVIADHIRALTFAIADGAVPSNEGRGYVLRRILRRACRFGRGLDLHDPFLHRIVPVVAEIMGDAFPEVREKQAQCGNIIRIEEENFNRTLDRGIDIFEQIYGQMKKNNQTVMDGKEAFRLYDTFGFPVDLTRLMAEEKGFSIDMDGFEAEMEKQREQARATGKFITDDSEITWGPLKSERHSHFTGYAGAGLEGGSLVQAGEGPDEYRLIFEETPFYAESGGQVGDTGEIIAGETKLEVFDTKKAGDKIIHFVKKTGPLPDLDCCRLAVNEETRRRTACHHSATHLLHAALRKVLGEHVHQAGSLVDPGRLRFDFTHNDKIRPEQLDAIENLVNEWIRRSLPVETLELSYQDALKAGAMALFGEKYGDIVRMVRISEYSKELCGGTHVKNTAEILYFRVLSESSIATGTRRIEAAAGPAAIELAKKNKALLESISGRLNCEINSIEEKIIQLLKSHAELERQLGGLRESKAKESAESLWKDVKSEGGKHYLVAKINDMRPEYMHRIVDDFKKKYGTGVAVIGSSADGKPSLVAGVTDNYTDKLHADTLINEIASVIGGSGGGKPGFARAGGKNPGKLDEALQKAESIIKSSFSS
ncbi:MAG: alanine--tRNA ligase [Bacillota bacterium]